MHSVYGTGATKIDMTIGSRLTVTPFLSCPVVNQALLCHGSCEEDFKSCLQNCESEADVQCILACADVYDECEIKCPCRIDGECESGCPCPSFECEPVCEDAVDLEGSKVNINLCLC